MRWNQIDHMNAARANKPASGGKVYRQPARKQPTTDDNYSWIRRQVLAPIAPLSGTGTTRPGKRGQS